jgi:hypothetical protein
MTKIHHFYHVYADGDWLFKLSDHIRALKTYGLYEKLESFNIGCVGSDANFNNVVAFLQENDIKCTIVSHAHVGWEQVTLNHLWLKAKTHQNDIFLYCHTKGAANIAHTQEIWRMGMTKKLVVEWERCVPWLKGEYSTLGCHYYLSNPDNPNPFWGGNFWWATGKHINLLDKCKNEQRHNAEAWIGTIYQHPEFKPLDIWPVPISSPTEGY